MRFSYSIVLTLALLIAGCRSDSRLEWHEETTYRWAELSVPFFGEAGFEALSPDKTGIDFINNLTEQQTVSNRVLLNGSGVALGDVDGDGLTDIYLCRLEGPNKLYRNLGNWKFEDITEKAGAACDEQFSSGAAMADIDGDHDLDLLVTSVGGPNACFLNDGHGRFTNVTRSAGLLSKAGSMTMALADVDGDMDLDLYVANYKTLRAKDIFAPFELGFRNIVHQTDEGYEISPRFRDHYVLEIRGNQVLWFETGEPDALLLNKGDGTFQKAVITEASISTVQTNGGAEPKDWGLMARFQDMDDDGDPDIYVCNDFESPDRIWINDGRGRFEPIARSAIRNTSNSSMAIDFSDIDRDGDLDFFVADMLSRRHSLRKRQMGTSAPNVHIPGMIDNRPEYMRNTMFLNRGDHTFSEIAQYSGVQASEWSWSVLFHDVDLDGLEDLLISTGNYYDAQDLDADEEIRQRARSGSFNKDNAVKLYPKLATHNVAFRNNGDLTFADVSSNWGFSEPDISNGMALGDLDNDGDLDLVINRFQKPAGLLRNKTREPRLAVRLRGKAPNTQAIGARITVRGGPVDQSKEVIAGGAYLSHSDPLYVFPTGNTDELDIEIRWRNGKRSSIVGRPNRIYEIFEPEQSEMSPDQSEDVEKEAIFVEFGGLTQGIHHEPSFEDFRRQPLLPNRLSQQGPGLTWFDLEADGDEDLLMTNGKGGRLSCFLNNSGAGFLAVNALPEGPGFEQTAVIGYMTRDQAPALWVGYSNYEEPTASKSVVVLYTLRGETFQVEQQLTIGEESIGHLALADHDDDGDLDLFVAGRVIPSRYPEPATSYLFRNNNGQFAPDTLNSEVLTRIGMVSGAVFSDFDNDNDPDLFLALEWGTIKALRNEAGKFVDVTSQLGFAGLTGWWNGVTSGDLNGDGLPDLIATNWGLNSKYNMYADKPLLIYFKDFDNDGTVDVLEAYPDPETGEVVPERGLNALSQALSLLRLRIKSHQQFAGSNLEQIIGPALHNADAKEASTLAHTVFFNRGAHFEAMSLPAEAQLAPAFYAGVADFNGDGHEDLFLSQNFFAVQPETPRLDAGRGLWLQGDGQGNLEAVPGQISGIRVYGEQRGAALGDFNADARIDLAISQNGAPLKLYQNKGAKQGLRVELVGAPGNHNAVGAKIRLRYESGYGPVREIHAGSGYWSQDAFIQVMGKSGEPKAVQVDWPDGQTTETPVPKGASTILIEHPSVARATNQR